MAAAFYLVLRFGSTAVVGANWVCSEGAEAMTGETIHIPRHIAAAIVDAVGWMVGEGQAFEDQEAGKELMDYIAATYPELVPDWMER